MFARLCLASRAYSILDCELKGNFHSGIPLKVLRRLRLEKTMRKIAFVSLAL